jgi:hypothetical protein
MDWDIFCAIFSQMQLVTLRSVWPLGEKMMK